MQFADKDYILGSIWWSHTFTILLNIDLLEKWIHYLLFKGFEIESNNNSNAKLCELNHRHYFQSFQIYFFLILNFPLIESHQLRSRERKEGQERTTKQERTRRTRGIGQLKGRMNRKGELMLRNHDSQN